MNVPKLRFKEFDGEWEYHQFSEIVNRVSKSSNSNILPKVEFEDIVAGEGRLKKNVANKFDDRKGTLFQPNNILYGKLRPYLKNWLFPKFQGVALGDFWVFEAVNSAPAFLYTLIQSENYQRAANDTAGTKMPRSDWKKVSTTKFAIPMNIKEQEKIGNFFEILDKKIQLQQQKIDLLQEQKKGFLQKMFPKAGETQPEMRFDGFIEDWKSQKLDDFIIDYVEKTTMQNQHPVLTSSQKQGIVLQEEYFSNRQVTTDNNIGYFVLPKGYFTFRSRSDNDIFVFNRNDIIDKGIISYFYPVFTLKDADSDFFLYRINNGIQRQITIAAEGTGQHVLSLKKFKNIVAMFPSFEEQKKIGEFIGALDNKIKVQKRKLALLQNQKQGFMQQMFI